MPESLPPELSELRARVEALVAELRELEPQVPEEHGDLRVPESLRARVRARSQELGFFQMTQPREVGGTEAGPLALTVLREALAAGNTPFSRDLLGPDPGLLRHAEGALRERYLEPVVRGERAWAFAFTEPSGDADARPTWARRDGDLFRVTGRKAFVSGGATADFFATLVNVDADAGEPGGTAILLVDRGTPGVELTRSFESIDGGGHVELTFEDAPVPRAHLLGGVGEGMPRALGNIDGERLASAATASGIAMWAVDYTTRHIAAGHRSGRRLGDREGVRLRYAEMRVESYAARAMLYRTARLVEAAVAEDSGRPLNATNEVAATKLFCTEAAGRIVDTAIQLVGGQALVRGHPLERVYRRVRSMRLGAGASDILRLSIARGILEFDTGRL